MTVPTPQPFDVALMRRRHQDDPRRWTLKALAQEHDRRASVSDVRRWFAEAPKRRSLVAVAPVAEPIQLDLYSLLGEEA